MKVLYVTTRPPYPPHRGDQLIAFEQIRNLSNEKHELFLVSLIRNDDEKDAVITEMGAYCKQIYFIKLNKILSFFSVFKTFLNLKPMQVNMYTNSVIKNRLKEISLVVKPDIIHIQTIRLAELLLNEKANKVLDMIDILSLNMERRAIKEKFFLKQILKFESILLKRYEVKMIKKYNSVSIVSENDLFHSHLKYNLKINVNPNGTSFIEKIPNGNDEIIEEDIIIFHGNMSYFPNIEAVLSFIHDVWPTIHRKHPTYKFYIVGKDPVDKIMKYNGKDNIVVTGFVNDISEYLYRAKIGIYPLNSGTGMQNKILEALACGLPTIASNFAIQGVKNITSKEILIANKKEEYINAIDKLFEDNLLRESYKKNGRKFIFDNYSWNRNTEKLMQMWEDAFKLR